VQGAWSGEVCEIPGCTLRPGSLRFSNEGYVDHGTVFDPNTNRTIPRHVELFLRGVSGGELISFRVTVGAPTDERARVPVTIIPSEQLLVTYSNMYLQAAVCASPSAQLVDPQQWLYEVSCTMPEGAGGHGHLDVSVGQLNCSSVPGEIPDELSYALPVFTANTTRTIDFRDNIAGYATPGSVVARTEFGEEICFDVEHIPSAAVLAPVGGLAAVVNITYGSVVNATDGTGLDVIGFPCAFLPENSTVNTLCCRTTPRSTGTKLLFGLRVTGLLAVVPPDRYSNPVSPTIRAARGCRLDDDEIAKECPARYTV